MFYWVLKTHSLWPKSTFKDISFLGVLNWVTVHKLRNMWKLFLHLVIKGETCQSFPNSIRGVWGKSPLPAGELKFWWKEGLFHQVVKIWPFSKLKTPFCKYLNINKIKLRDLYEIKMEMVQEQRLQLENEVFIGL